MRKRVSKCNRKNDKKWDDGDFFDGNIADFSRKDYVLFLQENRTNNENCIGFLIPMDKPVSQVESRNYLNPTYALETCKDCCLDTPYGTSATDSLTVAE
jgi:hypothetical protein